MSEGFDEQSKIDLINYSLHQPIRLIILTNY